MDANRNTGVTQLDKGHLLRVAQGRGRGIAVFRGEVWVTQDGDLRDQFVSPGQTLAFDRPGLVIVQALEDSSVLLLESD